ncbi:ADP-ribose pyrophosphatase [Pseudoalteromonas ulvae UL12]|uniref:ADP-ribose diphosphatase n=1 Tax=Pseudoalteromonas ulvae TaxID=107327 RepID=UPI00186BA3DC|nr:ADP-ribose diphosphatase [Pseudoalteromonas ulvae]MBE0362977.1 ADP-ribose pyrophosphatase [Pseudoalteromonas ulvae UL12]
MINISTFNDKDVEVVKKTSLYRGFFKIEGYAFKHRLFAGGHSEIIHREILERGHAVAVLPYDPNTNNVLLIEQIRIGALASKNNPWLLECIAGMADGSTDYESVVRKEAQEEAGIELDQLEFMMSYLSSPGGTTERLFLYAARADLSQAGGLYGLASEGEDIKVHVLPLTQALELLADGTIDNAATVISLQWMALNQTRLMEQWANQTRC